MRVWPSEAPPQVTREGVTHVHEGGPTVRPVSGAGVDYTPGGGLRHYAAEAGAIAAQ